MVPTPPEDSDVPARPRGGADRVTAAEQAVAAARAGAEERFAAEERVEPTDFLRENLARLVRFGAALCGNVTEAEDLVGAAVVAVLPRWQSITGSPYAYVRQAVLNEHISGVRKQIRRRRLEPVPLVGVEPDGSERVHNEITVGIALAELGDLQRTVLVLRYFEDLPVAAVARALDRPEGTIRRITHEGLTALRAQNLFAASGEES